MQHLHLQKGYLLFSTARQCIVLHHSLVLYQVVIEHYYKELIDARNMCLSVMERWRNTIDQTQSNVLPELHNTVIQNTSLTFLA